MTSTLDTGQPKTEPTDYEHNMAVFKTVESSIINAAEDEELSSYEADRLIGQINVRAEDNRTRYIERVITVIDAYREARRPCTQYLDYLVMMREDASQAVCTAINQIVGTLGRRYYENAVARYPRRADGIEACAWLLEDYGIITR